MTPILGIIASSISGSKVVTGSYESIATVTVGSGGTSSVSFSSIASTWTHLQVRCIARTNRGYASDALKIRFGDTSGNYIVYHYLLGTGASAGSAYEAATNKASVYGFPGNSATSNIFGAGIFDILDYANTNKNKTIRSLCGNDQNGGTSGEIELNSHLYLQTNAISTIEFFPHTGTLINQYSHFALYGIKA